MRQQAQSTAPNAVKAVGIWIRVSTEMQVESESPAHHEARCRAYATSRGWQIRKAYRLEATSGKSVLNLPQTQEMLEDVRAGRISGLVFSNLSRLARNTRELLELAAIFQEYEADLISLAEALDTSTPAGRLFFTVQAGLAAFERESTAARVAASVPIRAQMGKSTGGAAPFGYQWVNHQLVPDEKEAPVRRLIYELFDKHRRKKTVARLLNEAGHRTRNGSEWSDTTIVRLIQDPTAKGVRRANWTKSLGAGKHWVMKPESEWVLGEAPAIVDAELWERCNAALQARRNGKKPPAKKTSHLFAGFVACHCGSKMYVPSNMPSKYTCKTRGCKNKIAVTDLDAVFHEQLRNFFMSPEELAGYLGQADEEVRQRTELLENLASERQNVAQEMQKVYRLYTGDEISPDGFGRIYRPLEERLKQLEDQMPKVQAELDYLKIQRLSSDEIFAEANDLYAHWQEMDQEQKRGVVEAITESIIIGTDTVSITWGYVPDLPAGSPSSEEPSKRQRNHTGSSRPRAEIARETSAPRAPAKS